MIAAWMLYCTGIGLALTLAAYAAERALYLAGRPTRWAWSGALIGTLFLPIAATVRPQAFRVIPVPLAEPTRAPAAAAAAALPQGTAPSTPVSGRALRLSDFDGVLRWGWGLSSVAALLVLAAAAARLVALRRRWRTALVDGRSVLLADDVGPAVAGLWPPRVVIPAWALNLTQTQRRLMLAHEDEHVRARDPWLLAAGTAALVLAPWNLALWWLSQRLRLAVEMDCDARVLAREGDAPAYGELLLRVGQRRARLPLGAPALSEPASFLGRRIRRMVTALPRWRWAGATAASMLAAAAILAACEAPRPVGPQASSDRSAVVETERGPYSPGASYLRVLAHEYHPEVFAHPLPGAAVAFVFDAQDSVVGHAAGVREASDDGCLGVVDRLVPAFQTRKWSSSGCAAGAYQDTTVVVCWKSLRNLPARQAERNPTGAPAVAPSALSVSYLRVLAHEYHPEVFAHPLPAPAVGALDPRDRLGVGHAAIAFVLDKGGRVVGHAAGVREAGYDGCLGVVDRLVPAFRASKWHSSGCADAADKGGGGGGAVIYWKLLEQVQGADDVLNESMVDEPPVFLSGPPLVYPNLLRQAGIQGRVMVRAIIDTTGRAERASVQVIESPHPGFNQSAKNFVLEAQFRHGRFRGRPVRVLIEFPVEFRTRG